MFMCESTCSMFISMIFICMTLLSLCQHVSSDDVRGNFSYQVGGRPNATEDLSNKGDLGVGLRHDKEIFPKNKGSAEIIEYRLDSVEYMKINILGNSSVNVNITHINRNYSDFLVVHAHSQGSSSVLKFNNSQNSQEEVASGMNPALVILLPQYYYNPVILLENNGSIVLSVVLIIRNYTNIEPIPGGIYPQNSSESYPHPYLSLNQNLLTTIVSFPLASVFSVTEEPSVDIIPSNRSDVVPSFSIQYYIYLSYLYEGNLAEDHYVESIVKMSTISGLEKYATKVYDVKLVGNSSPELLFVSYSGVGAVVNVLASFNGSSGVLYSTAVFYGCDFIPGEEYKCTKLVSNFAKIVCACFPFFGLLLLFLGHRWLNITMFTSGLLTSWFLLFITFVQIPNVDVRALGICTLIAAALCGFGWLTIWHWYKRPFHSALLLILLSSLFTAMISTHFLKYAMVPSRHNIAAFVVFPIVFALAIVIYSIFDIKKTHIFSCCILGSYLLVVPFAFYFGSSLTYIVINVVSLMVVKGFSEAIGYPPFQFVDIIFLCIWIAFFLLGMSFQFYRERSGPPFYPPNLSSMNVFIRVYDWIKRKVKSLFYDEFGVRRPLCGCCSTPYVYDETFGSYHQINSHGNSSRWDLMFGGCSDCFRRTKNFFRRSSRFEDSHEQLHHGNSE